MGDTLLQQAPYVDLVMGPDGYRSLPDALGRLETASPRRERRQLAVLEFHPAEN
jgi:hypothetical protein